ncbi:MAG TPA: iron-sulfur cluster co-chaperone HscB C-terminal domain-containing protein [Chitinophagaceae bacterium]|nr:iron-sulfur cluster co-chaperone HscB C-terminal domain-containing protein [Chitinophagaceae bacterium]
MNYFELFELPVSLQVDKNYLQTKYFELQKKYHPDFFSNESEEEQADVLEKSSMINKGYKVFQKDDETIKYVLLLKEIMEEEEKYELPPEFLAEMMDLNETLMDVDDSTLEETETKISQMEKYLYDKVQNIIEYYNEDNTTNEQLLQIKDYYFKKKYLNRILARLDEMRNIASRN